MSVGVQISDGVDVAVGDDGVDARDLRAGLGGKRSRPRRQRVGDRDELGSGVRRDVAAVNAADAASAEKSHANHRRLPVFPALDVPRRPRVGQPDSGENTYSELTR